jgi:hypothetical protein
VVRLDRVDVLHGSLIGIPIVSGSMRAAGAYVQLRRGLSSFGDRSAWLGSP